MPFFESLGQHLLTDCLYNSKAVYRLQAPKSVSFNFKTQETKHKHTYLACTATLLRMTVLRNEMYGQVLRMDPKILQ